MVTDLSFTYVMAGTQNRRKLVRSYGDSGPPVIWAIATLIDLLLAKTVWEAKPNPGSQGAHGRGASG